MIVLVFVVLLSIGLLLSISNLHPDQAIVCINFSKLTTPCTIEYMIVIAAPMSEFVPVPPRRRNYVKRKRYLNESVSLIKKTLEYIATATQSPINPDKITLEATTRAKQVEAACWDSVHRLPDDHYSRLLLAKTRECCFALISLNLGQAALVSFLQFFAFEKWVSQLQISVSPRATREEEPPEPSFPQFPSLELGRDSGGPEAPIFDSSIF
jgi:hypothetical protein